MVEMYNWFTEIIDGLLNFLPSDPFIQFINDIDTTNFGYLNYFIPFHDMCTVLSVWIVSVTIWYLYKVVLRWLKVA